MLFESRSLVSKQINTSQTKNVTISTGLDHNTTLNLEWKLEQ